jgi:hypothetical protein
MTTEYIKEAADKFGKRENDLTGGDRIFARPVLNSYFFKVPEHGFNGDADSPLALNCSNLPHPLPEGWVALTDPVSKKTYYYHEATRTTRWDRPKPNDQPSPDVSEHDNLAPIGSVKSKE